MVTVGLLWTLWFVLPGDAFGCSLASPEPLWVHPDPADSVAPWAPRVLAVEVNRGAEAEADQGQRVSTSCDDVGWVAIHVEQPDQDPHTRAEVGYLLELDGGAMPEGMVLPQIPWLGATLVLPWLDVGNLRRLPVVFTLRITPVDVAGNLGEPVWVDVSDATVVGCGGCGLGTPWGAALPSVALLVLLRRRQTH